MQQQHLKFGDISYYAEYKVNILRSICGEFKSNLKILEFGCGVGRNLGWIQKYYSNSDLYAYDISTESIQIAKKNNPNIKIISDEFIESTKCYFDIIFIAGVFHHIPPDIRDDVIKTLFGLLKNTGSIVVFEHNPYNPLTRYMVNTCEFDENAELLTKKELIKLFVKEGFILSKSSYSLFFPPKLSGLNFMEKFIWWFPLGGQYYLHLKK
jgi:SAM-dependent methyltransferase